MPHKGLKRRNAKKDQVTKYIQMGMFIIETGKVQFLVQKSVEYKVLDLICKYTFGPLYSSSKFMIACQIAVLIHFQIARL